LSIASLVRFVPNAKVDVAALILGCSDRATSPG
jgi:hypothetical protein